MAKKDRRRRGQGQPPAPTAGSTPADAATSGETAEQRRARQVKEWEERKRRKELRGKIHVPIIGTTTVGALVGGVTSLMVVIGAFVGVFLLLSGGSDGGGRDATPTPDPRVAGEPIAKTVELEATDNGVNINPSFDPTVITGRAGEVIEIKMTNTGSSAHNLNVAGIDGEFGSRDDFVIDSIDPGEEASLLVKLDESGTYPFQCDLHPGRQSGQLILS